MENTTNNEARPEIILEQATNSLLIKNVDVQDEIVFAVLNDTEESNIMEAFQKIIHLGALEINGNHCIVCERPLKGTTYTCPICDTRYCIRCAIELSKNGEPCKTCTNELQF